jgi:hypothetical protein
MEHQHHTAHPHKTGSGWAARVDYFKRHLRYHLDNALTRGPIAFLTILFVFALISDVIMTIFVVLSGDENLKIQGNHRILEIFWVTTTSMLDPGTFAEKGGWPSRIPLLIDTLLGIVFVSFIVAILTNTMDDWMHRLRRGRTNVLEANHTVILGWSTYVTEIIDQIILAHDIQVQGASWWERRVQRSRPCITVLADMDKADMEDYLREHVRKYTDARIRCRRGSPIDTVDLRIVNCDKANSVIVLRTESPYAEVELLKVLLTLARLVEEEKTSSAGRTTHGPHVVAELTQTENLALLEVIEANPRVQLIQVGTFVSRLIAQSALQPGLSNVYSRLFDFADLDLNFVVPEHLPRTFGDAVLMYTNGIVIGYQRPGDPPKLNPTRDTPLAVGDSVIVVATDRHSLELSAQSSIDFHLSPENTVIAERQITHTLLIGWNWRTKTVIRELDSFALPGSTLTVLAKDFSGEAYASPVSFSDELAMLPVENLVLSPHVCDTTDRAALATHMRRYDHVIIMAYACLPDKQHADAHTIMTLSHMRHFLKTAAQRYNIVTEIMDSRNSSLMASADVDDFIISDKIVSMYLAQISYEARLHTLYTELLTVNGNEIYLKPVTRYVDITKPVTFRLVVAAALLQHEVVIGYRRGNVLQGDADPNELILNPM